MAGSHFYVRARNQTRCRSGMRAEFLSKTWSKWRVNAQVVAWSYDSATDTAITAPTNVRVASPLVDVVLLKWCLPVVWNGTALDCGDFAAIDDWTVAENCDLGAALLPFMCGGVDPPNAVFEMSLNGENAHYAKMTSFKTERGPIYLLARGQCGKKVVVRPVSGSPLPSPQRHLSCVQDEENL
eukprot:g17988.t1